MKKKKPEEACHCPRTLCWAGKRTGTAVMTPVAGQAAWQHSAVGEWIIREVQNVCMGFAVQKKHIRGTGSDRGRDWWMDKRKLSHLLKKTCWWSKRQMEADETQHEWGITKNTYKYLFKGFLTWDIDKWIEWISTGIWDDGLCISQRLQREEMSKKEQRPEAPQANSRREEGARSPMGMLVEVAPVALLPGTGCWSKMPEQARGRDKGGECRRGWR